MISNVRLVLRTVPALTYLPFSYCPTVSPPQIHNYSSPSMPWRPRFCFRFLPTLVLAPVCFLVSCCVSLATPTLRLSFAKIVKSRKSQARPSAIDSIWSSSSYHRPVPPCDKYSSIVKPPPKSLSSCSLIQTNGPTSKCLPPRIQYSDGCSCTISKTDQTSKAE
ncbi:hypothetical protein B0H16DRAFT_1570432 [Mycena metata]|uniref:Uncharacterized protein n=1 Tax=Mycena metata TaxID=1033252 RepID=A0AAD7I9T2_9AGAR|nr:hypothetical protein B0H16DRAFT_1570432 [Mycena metata]